MKANLWRALLVAGMLAPGSVRSEEPLETPEVEAASEGTLVLQLGKLRSENRASESLRWIAKRLEEKAGVTAVEINDGRREVRVTYDLRTDVRTTILRTIETTGFRAVEEATAGGGGGDPSAVAAPLR